MTLRGHLSDGRIRIRRFRAEDAGDLYEAARASFAELNPWLPWCHADYSRAESESWVETRAQAWSEGEAYSFRVEEVETGRFLGGVGLDQVDPVDLCANLGYWIRSDACGAGAATAAAALAARFGLEDLQLSRLEILVATGNLASQRVAEKVGAAREGLLRARLRRHGQSLDAVCFSIVPAWSPPRA